MIFHNTLNDVCLFSLSVQICAAVAVAARSTSSSIFHLFFWFSFQIVEHLLHQNQNDSFPEWTHLFHMQFTKITKNPHKQSDNPISDRMTRTERNIYGNLCIYFVFRWYKNNITNDEVKLQKINGFYFFGYFHLFVCAEVFHFFFVLFIRI